jgi:signal transduction histidine kinase/sugar phosphate isomerase/epimerase
MKLGFQTILWGPRLDDVDGILDALTAAGFQGVEFSQRPEQLNDIAQLCRSLDQRGLAFLGLAGGTLQERMEYCRDIRPQYLYVETWHPDDCPMAVRKGFTLALHPHVFKPDYRLQDALALLEAHPELKFLPDTAHLYISGDDPAEAIRRVDKSRLAGVHFKDWMPDFGRYSHRYARGFREVGTGVVDLDAVLLELRKINYDGWLVIEQNWPRVDPQTSLQGCIDWLVKKELLAPGGKAINVPVRAQKRPAPPALDPVRHASFLRAVVQGGAESLERCYQAIAEACCDLFPCRLAVLCACCPAHDFLSLLALYPHPPLSALPLTLSLRHTLAGEALARQAVTHFDLTEPAVAARFGEPELLRELGLQRMVAVPILNPWNPTHVRLLVALFPADGAQVPDDNCLFEFGQDIGMVVDGALDSRCYLAVAAAAAATGKSSKVQELAGILKDQVQELVGCEGVSIFLANDRRDRLKLAATTGLEWTVPNDQQFYRMGEGLTGRAWERKEPLLTLNARQVRDRLGKANEVVRSENQFSYLIAPMVDARGDILGVVRCRNKQPAPHGYGAMFSDDDIAILDAVAQGAIPHLQILLGDARRANALLRMTHELKNPIVAVRGATEQMQIALRDHRLDPKVLFGEDYLDDVWSWSELMRRLLGNIEALPQASGSHHLLAQKALLMADVVAPVVRQVAPLLRERRFSPSAIHYGRFEKVPRLWIDVNRFQQVLFNLLSNAIKYAFNDPKAFQVEIDGDEADSLYVMRVRDWGIGIAQGLEELIFKEGYRGSAALALDTAGQGIGLWVVRQVLEAHGGWAELTNRHLPTEFTLRLPESLARHAPRGAAQKR